MRRAHVNIILGCCEGQGVPGDYEGQGLLRVVGKGQAASSIPLPQTSSSLRRSAFCCCAIFQLTFGPFCLFLFSLSSQDWLFRTRVLPGIVCLVQMDIVRNCIEYHLLYIVSLLFYILLLLLLLLLVYYVVVVVVLLNCFYLIPHVSRFLFSSLPYQEGGGE